MSRVNIYTYFSVRFSVARYLYYKIHFAVLLKSFLNYVVYIHSLVPMVICELLGQGTKVFGLDLKIGNWKLEIEPKRFAL